MRKLALCILSSFVLFSSFAEKSFAGGDKPWVQSERVSTGSDCTANYPDQVSGRVYQTVVHHGDCVLSSLPPITRKLMVAEVEFITSDRIYQSIVHQPKPQACWTADEWNDCIATMTAAGQPLSSCADLENAGFEWVI